MINEQKLLKEIESVLEEISANSFSMDSQYYCGTNLWQFRPSHIYETSLTEKIVKKLSYFEDIIGWEVSYPQDIFKSKKAPCADFAYGHIEKHYFDTVVEVKKWDGHEETQYSIWNDILKLYKYTSTECESAGNNKYMLVLYIGFSYHKEEITDIVKFFLVNPTVDTLNYGGHDISDNLKKIAIDHKWSQEDTDLLFNKYKHLFNNVPFIEFKEEYVLHDPEEKLFAFVIKLKD